MSLKRPWLWVLVLAIVAATGFLIYQRTLSPRPKQESATKETAQQTEPKDRQAVRTGAEPKIVAPVRDPNNPTPEYPVYAMRRHQEGVVYLHIHVGRDGTIKEAKVLQSSGFTSLDLSTLDTVKRKWRYTPATRDGKPIAMWHKVKFTFSCMSDGEDICNEERLASGR